MTVTELATLLERYDSEELAYVVLVEHSDGELELPSTGLTRIVPSRDPAR